eukprot:gene12553-16835_t
MIDGEHQIVSNLMMSYTTVVEENLLSGLVEFHLDILKYYPRSTGEKEIQLFNLYGKIPSRLLESVDSVEAIASWLLSNEQLERNAVAMYLSDTGDKNNKRVLEKIADRICYLEVGSHFVEGLKLYIPVIGYMDPITDDIYVGFVPEMIRYVLQIYVHSHLLNSRKPISTDLNDVPILVELSLIILDFCRILKSNVNNQKSNSQILNDFTMAVKGLDTSSALSNDVVITELFNMIHNNKPLTTLKLPYKLPSYLFASSKKSGLFSFSRKLDEEFQRLLLRLTDDALYLFELTGQNDDEDELLDDHTALLSETICLRFCIPLRNIHVILCDENDSCSLLELIDTQGNEVSLIEYVMNNKNPTNSINGEAWVGRPANVSYHSSIYLDFSNSISNINNLQINNKIISNSLDAYETTMRWMEMIESSCWDS